jgi:3-hydroxyanthranilate 3,4-dioxygenase
MSASSPFHCAKNTSFGFSTELESLKPLMKPPVGNYLLYGRDEQLKVMLVAGPNARKDFHINQGEELFYQIEGKCDLNIVVHNVHKTVTIEEGQMFILPGGIPHSPQRFAGTLGMVIERERGEGEFDGLRWYQQGAIEDSLKEESKVRAEEKAGIVLYEEYFQCTDLGTQLAPIIQTFLQSEMCLKNIPAADMPVKDPPAKIDSSMKVMEPIKVTALLSAVTPFSISTVLQGKEFVVKAFYGSVENKVRDIFCGDVPQQIFVLSFASDGELSSSTATSRDSITIVAQEKKWEMHTGDGMYLTLPSLPVDANLRIGQPAEHILLFFYNTSYYPLPGKLL